MRVPGSLKIRSAAVVVGLATFALVLTAATAVAAPVWSLSMTNSPTTLPRTDERMEYAVTVKNEAVAGLQVGAELACNGTPAEGANWFGKNPEPTFTYQWVRNGQDIPGATERTYTATSEDAGKSLQCVVTGTSDPDGAGTTFAPISSAAVSLPPVVVEPAPSPAPPGGIGRPEFGGSFSGASLGSEITCTAPNVSFEPWSGFATGNATPGSNVVTEVVTASGSGSFTNGSKLVTGVSAELGSFAVGQTITSSANGIPAGTTIVAVGAGTLELSVPATHAGPGAKIFAGAQPFAAGQVIEGTGIPAGTTITKVEGETLTLSAGVAIPLSHSISLTGPALGGSSWSFRWLRNGEPIPGATNASYTVTSADTEPPSSLQCEAIAKDAAGDEAISPSGPSPTEPRPPAPYSSPAGSGVTVALANASSGQVTAEVELPGGAETLVYEAIGNGWTCSAQQPVGEVHGHVACTRSDPLAPGRSYPPISIAVSLGTDAPEVGTAVATVSGGGAADPAGAEATYSFEGLGLPFGILDGSFEAGVFDEAGTTYTQAGGHPFRGYSTFGFNTHHGVNGRVFPTGNIKDVVVDLPRGFQGNALATPELCGSIEEVILDICPPRSVVGGINIYATVGEALRESLYPDHLLPRFANLPIYSLEPEFGEPAQFAFAINPEFGESETPYTFVPELRPEEGYAISFRTAPIVTVPALYGTDVNLCDFGAKLTGTGRQTKFDSCRRPTEAGAYPNPLITNPTRCSGPPPTSGLRVDSWEHPAEVKTYDFTAPAITGCEAVAFEPEAELAPTNHDADSPTGLGVEITMPTEGLLSPTGVGQANLDNATVTFPKGMTINPAAAEGLGSCTPEEVKLHSNADAECPESSKIGTIEIDTPIIRNTLTGSIYVAKQNHNPFNAPIGIYLVFSSPRDGVTIKVAGKLTPDPQTGQLVSSFVENVEAPFSRLAIHFNEGPRAPLINPPKCGSYPIVSEFSPWSAENPANPTREEIVTVTSKFKITHGPGGGPCPSGNLEPQLSAGLQNTQAGSKSPFVLDLSRPDGSQRFTGLTDTNPKGLTAYLKGVATCPLSVVDAISTAEESGAAEIANPSCPASSQVGIAEAGAGAGPNPFYVKSGKVYLSGPYKGAPISLAIVTPAVAGPFDFGNVVVKTPLYIDPETAQVKAVSDPIPTEVHNIALDVRDIRVDLNRPGFTAAPTNCEPSAVEATVSGESGATATVSNRFQVGGCENLAFKPKLALHLYGGTHRAAHPRLRATVTYPEGSGYANIARAQVALPHSEFLDQSHIKTICTRVQFAAKACPAGSVYGHAEATTPLLDYPLSGPVYLRSSSNKLPDLVAALRGPESQPIEVVLDGRIDSIHGGIRTTFATVPDQPVSSFTLNMQGGKKGLLVNSRNLCKSVNKGIANFTAQNGKAISLRPRVQNSCGKAKKKKGRRSKKRKHAKAHQR